MSMRNPVIKLACVLLFASVLASCGGVRKNVNYFPTDDAYAKLDGSVSAVVLPVVDARESAKIYPKQIISHTSYYDEKTFDINDKPVEEVFQDALSMELYSLGVGVVTAHDIGLQLGKETKGEVRDAVVAKYPEARIVVGLKVVDFMAYSKRNLLSTDVRYAAAVELNVLDVKTGELLWADHKTEKTDMVMSADRNDMVEELNLVLSEVMKKAVKDNLSLRDALVRASGR